MYPEFTGTVLADLLDVIPEAGTPEEVVFEDARDGLAEEYDMTLLEPMAFNNTYTLAVTSVFCRRT